MTRLPPMTLQEVQAQLAAGQPLRVSNLRYRGDDLQVIEISLANQVPGLIRVPHHTVDLTAMVGKITEHGPILGELTLASGGALILDDIGRFDRATLEGLAAVLDQGMIELGPWRLPACPRIVVGRVYPCGCGARPGQQCLCRRREKLPYVERQDAAEKILRLRSVDLAHQGEDLHQEGGAHG